MRVSRYLRRAGVALFAAALALLCVHLLSPPLHAQGEKAAVGKASQCAPCHEDQVKSFAATRHGKADAYQVWGFTESCASCHGDATAHVDSADPAKIRNPRKLSTAEASGTCLKCHGNEHVQSFWQGSQHESSDLSCLSCHSIHHAKAPEKLLVKRTEMETCLSCHTGMRKAQFQRSTHLFRDEYRNARVTCTDCHNPHGSEAPKLVKAASTNDTCYACHTEKRGPFLWSHSPAQENCMNCHSPHGSNNQSLLTMRTTQLCQSCHMQGRHQTVAGRSNAAFTFNRSCLNCHSQIHGSNHPSGVNLQR
jgi:DmsE family decaheme c-type cytochrome